MIRTLLLAAALFVAGPSFAETSARKPATPAPMATPAPAPAAKMSGEAQRLDLNSATVEQLMGVKGLNKTIAEAIVRGRPFKGVEDLTARKIISGEILSSVKDRLTVQ
jgi:competence protein ComEA